MTGPRVEKLVLVAPNPSGSPVPALVLVYLMEDDEVVVVDELVALPAEEEVDAAAAASGCALLVDDDVTEKSFLAGSKGFGTLM